MSRRKQPSNDNVTPLHDRITVTLSPKATKALRAEMARQIKEGWNGQTAKQIVEAAVVFHCEAMATKWIESRL